MGLPRPFELALHQGTRTDRLGGTAICGFNSKGAVGAIAVDQIIKTFDLEQLGSVLSDSFPAMALVRGRRPQHPVRIYQGEDIGAFVSDIPFPEEYNLAFGETVLKWFQDGGFNRLIVVDGLVLPSFGEEERDRLFGVSSTDAGRDALDNLGIECVEHGVVPGITGYLLAEADRLGIEVIALIPPVNPMFPDARAAVLALEAISDLIQKDIPLTELAQKAVEIEERVREVFSSLPTALPEPKSSEDDEDDPMIL